MGYVEIAKQQKQCHISGCTRSFKNNEGPSHMFYHFKTKHGNKDVHCSKCKFASAPIKPHEHRAKCIHDKTLPFQCNKCEYRANRGSELKSHIKFEHGTVKIEDEEIQTYVEIAKKQKQCPISGCTHRFKEKEIPSRIFYHIKDTHGVKNIQCSECKFVTVSTKRLTRHIKRIHDKSLSIKCAKCEFFADGNAELKMHIKSKHDKIRDHICHICGSSFLRKQHLQKHLSTVHGKE